MYAAGGISYRIIAAYMTRLFIVCINFALLYNIMPQENYSAFSISNQYIWKYNFAEIDKSGHIIRCNLLV